MSVISLTTDFGTKDWFVATMKGVIARLAPETTVIDLTHEIPPGDIRAGAFALMASARFFPRGTIHVAIVDPGVGGPRHALAIQTHDHLFLGPDNGILSWAVSREKVKAIHTLKNKKYFLEPVSQTFHGRDIFAAVAAELSCGMKVKELGPKLKQFVRLDWPAPRSHAGSIQGEVVYIDRFGNAITNLGSELLNGDQSACCEVFGLRRHVCPLKAYYGAAPLGKALAISGSSGFLEIAVNQDSAAQRLGLKIGTCVILRQESVD